MTNVPPKENRTRKTLIWALVGLGAVVGLQLCVLAGLLVVSPSARMRLFGGPVGSAPPNAPQRPAAPSNPTLIEDNFDTPTDRWDQSAARIVDGTYELRVDIPNYDSYGLLLGEHAVADFDMTVDAQQVAGSPTSEYGIRFRQTGPGDYLMFSISGSGYYRLVRVSNNQYTSIVPWRFDRRIKASQNASNQLRVVANGASITGYVNGTKLVDAKDDMQLAGQLTLGATTFTQGGLVVRFDNIAGQAGSAKLDEDFSDPVKAAWSVGGSLIVDGSYEISSSGGVQTWQEPLPNGASNVQDFKLSVDATLVRGDAQNGAAYGVMFGDDGSFNFYVLYLFPDGSISLTRQQSSQDPAQLLGPVPLDVLKTGAGQTNHIEIDLHNNNLKISINGKSLAQGQLQEPIRGMVGLIVTSRTDAVQARFDNFKLEPQ